MRFCEGIAKAKLGCRIVTGTSPVINNTAIVTIPNNHSLLFEFFMNFNGIATALGDSYHFFIMNSISTDYILIRFLKSTRQVALWMISGAGTDNTSRIPYPELPCKHYSFSVLLDRTNNRKKIYTYGQLPVDDAMGIVNPNFNTANNQIYLCAGGGIVTIDVTDILVRVTTLSSVPADIDVAIARMYCRPMVLDASLQAVAVIASQYDFEDVGYGTAAQTVVADHGLIGGFPLTSSVDLKRLYRIVEKP